MQRLFLLKNNEIPYTKNNKLAMIPIYFIIFFILNKLDIIRFILSDYL